MPREQFLLIGCYKSCDIRCENTGMLDPQLALFSGCSALLPSNYIFVLTMSLRNLFLFVRDDRRFYKGCF